MKLKDVPFGAKFRFADAEIERMDEVAKRHVSYHKWADLKTLPSMHFAVSSQSLLFPEDLQPQITPDRRTTGTYLGPFFATADLKSTEVELVEGPPLYPDYLPSRESFTTSCDPELFLVNGKGELISGADVLPTKKRPRTVPGGNTAYGLFHEDGFQAEFSPTHRTCHEQVVTGMHYTLKALLGHARTNASDKSITISPRNFVEIPAEMMAKASDATAALGCDPADNIYGTPAFTVDNPREFPYRMAGGHIHLGSPKIAKNLWNHAEPLIKAMDIFAGVGSVALFAGIEDPRRRQYYGRAGEFRKQPHGLEYRTLSNAWLCSPTIAHVQMNLARGAFRFGSYAWDEIQKFDFARVQHIINSFDVLEARKFIEENAAAFTFILNRDSGYQWAPKALRLMELGVAKVLPNWANFEKNWANVPNYNPAFQTQHEKLRRLETPEERRARMPKALAMATARRFQHRGRRINAREGYEAWLQFGTAHRRELSGDPNYGVQAHAPSLSAPSLSPLGAPPPTPATGTFG